MPGPVDPVEVLPVESAVQQDCAQEHEGADLRAIRAPWLFGLRRPRGESQEQAGQDGARGGRTSSNTVAFGSNNLSFYFEIASRTCVERSRSETLTQFLRMQKARFG